MLEHTGEHGPACGREGGEIRPTRETSLHGGEILAIVFAPVAGGELQ